MGTFNSGNCTVVNGSNTVNLFGVTYAQVAAAITPGSLFVRQGDQVGYQVSSVISGVSNPQLSLNANYGGVSGAGVSYEVCRSFSPFLLLPSIYGADRSDLAALIQDAWNKIDDFYGGKHRLASYPLYANNASALAVLGSGCVYRQNSAPDVLCITH